MCTIHNNNRPQKVLKASASHIMIEFSNWKNQSLIWNTSLKRKTMRLGLRYDVYFASKMSMKGYKVHVFLLRLTF